MKKCNSCGFIMPNSAGACPICGTTTKKSVPLLGKLILIILAVVILFPALAAGGLLQGVGGKLKILCILAVVALIFRKQR